MPKLKSYKFIFSKQKSSSERTCPYWQWIVCTIKKGNDRYLWSRGKTFTPCTARTIIFQRKNLTYLIVCSTQCTLFFSIRLFFLLPVCLPCVICGTYVTRINDVSWHITRHTRVPLGLFSHVLGANCNFESKQAISIDYSIWVTPN